MGVSTGRSCWFCCPEELEEAVPWGWRLDGSCPVQQGWVNLDSTAFALPPSGVHKHLLQGGR